MGETATFTVSATGAGLTYVWRKAGSPLSDGGNISGALSNTLTITNVSAADAANYDVEVSSTCGSPATSTPVALTVNPLPATVVAAGAGTFCTSTTITASNGGDGTIYFQGTTSNGTSTSTASSSEVVTSSGTYYFRAQSAAGCWGPQGSVAVVIQAAPGITGTPANICVGGNGTIAADAVNGCVIFTNSGTTLNGTWTAATDPVALRLSSTAMLNENTCAFDAAVTRNYVAQNFQVSVTGNYVFEMTNNAGYDGMGYIVTGAFTPGSCATGTFVRGDDDDGVAGDEPRLGSTGGDGAMTLSAGTTYTLISTTYSLSSGIISGTFAWTITPPGGGQIMLPASGTIDWYTTASGGTSFGSGSPFNPVGVANSGLANTNTPGTTTFYAACSNASACRTAVNFVIAANTFTGTGDWTDNARWSCGAPPATGDAFEIGAGANATLNTNFTVAGSLLMNATSTLTVNPANTLTVSGSANFNGQSVTFRSDNSGTSSLGQVTGSLTGATNVTVERYIPNIGFRSWRLLSVPTSGTQTINAAWQEGNAPLANGTPNYGTQITGTGSLAAAQAAGFDNTAASAALLRYNGTAWVGVPGTGGAISAEKAYFLYIRGERTKGVTGLTTNSSATTLRTNGTLATGDQPTAIPTTNSFAVVGNPYASAINFTTLSRTGGVTDAFYIYDSRIKVGNNVGAYQTFSGTNYYTSVTGGSYGTAGVNSNTTIESGQAFFVRTDGTPGGGTITIHENSKISGTNGSLGFRPASPAALVKMDSRLYVVSGADRQVADGNAVVFDPAYSTAIDGHDALKMNNAAANFAVQTAGRSLAIEGRQPITAADTLFYKMWNLNPQAYQLELIPANLASSGLIAVLEDSYLNSRTQLDLNTTTTVNFTVDANAASAATDRFRIVFRPSAPLPVTFISISANRTAAGVKADWKVTAERNIRSYEVERSADGRNFITAGTVTATGNSATELSYSFTDAAAPATTLFYRIRSIGTAGEVKYTNVVKVMAGSVKPGFAISPNPVEGGIVNLQFTNQMEGRYTVRLLGSNGQAVFTRVATHAGGNSTQVLTLPSTIARGTYQVEIIAPDKTRTTKTLLVNSK